MKIYLIIFTSLILNSCSTRSQLVYLQDSEKSLFDKVNYSTLKDKIQIGDILHIEVQTINPQAALPYNTIKNNQFGSKTIENLQLDGYLIDESKVLNYPILGKISVDDLSLGQLEEKINQLLVDGGHLTNLTVKVRRINSKFTVLGEVNSPGTFSFIDQKLNVLQALGYAGDLTIFGKRKGITLIREKNGIRKTHKIDLTNLNTVFGPYYQIKNNDIIIVDPNFSMVKSAGFIGSASTIASISSILLSVTLLIINR